MDLNAARDLVNDERLWPRVRDAFLASGTFRTYPKGDVRRVELLDDDTRREIGRWLKGLEKAAEWRKILDGAKVRELKATYPGVYPDVFRYLPYFARFDLKTVRDNPEALKLLLKLKFPEVYEICCS